MATARAWPDRVGGIYKEFCGWTETPPTFLSNHAIATHVVMHTSCHGPLDLYGHAFRLVLAGSLVIGRQAFPFDLDD